MAGLLVAVALVATACNMPDLEEEEARADPLAQTSMVFDANGKRLLRLHAEEDRTVIPHQRIPDVARDAVVAIEDKRFWSHRGVDLKALIRAAYVNASEGRVAQGGSTITQQYVKNTLVGTDRTLERKVREARLAWELEKKYSKEEILGRYMNT
ncbi:MAG: transglycosylase domain-containing protein, partial [Actinomycetota bacterium]|nr:transglycosylase domain-containing protein [Actinomycetota bacterium]